MWQESSVCGMNARVNIEISLLHFSVINIILVYLSYSLIYVVVFGDTYSFMKNLLIHCSAFSILWISYEASSKVRDSYYLEPYKLQAVCNFIDACYFSRYWATMDNTCVCIQNLIVDSFHFRMVSNDTRLLKLLYLWHCFVLAPGVSFITLSLFSGCPFRFEPSSIAQMGNYSKKIGTI